MSRSYTIGEHFERFIAQQVQPGSYASASDVVRAALRLLEDQERARLATLDGLRADIIKGLGSGPTKPADDVLARLEAKYVGMAGSQARDDGLV